MSRILVVDDDPAFGCILCQHLEQEGYETFRALSGREGLRSAYALVPDLILLDIKMADMDGRHVCKKLCETCQIPIILLSGLGEEKDVIQGLQLGAADYLVKPFGMAELQARIRAILRRCAGHRVAPERYDDGTLSIHPLHQCVQKRGLRVELSHTEFRLLIYLFERRGRVVPREELAHVLWDDAESRTSDYLSLYIRYLRRKIEDNPRQPTYLRTRYGVGYWFQGVGDPEPPLSISATGD